MKAEDLATIAQINKIIKEKRRFLVTSHIYPDGDAIGSVVGLSRALVLLGKEVYPYISDRIPDQFLKLPGATEIKNKWEGIEADIAFVLDASNLERIGDAYKVLPSTIVNIDHHPDNTFFGSINLVIPSSSSTSEVIFNLVKDLSLDKDIATVLYYGLISDTGGFMYNNTTKETFDIASKIVDVGILPGDIAMRLLYSIPYELMCIYIDILKEIKIDKESRLAWGFIPLEIMEDKIFQNNTSSLLDMILRISEVDTIALVKEHKDKFRVSLRSKDADVGSIARLLGGGGHRGAAAFDLPKSSKDIIIETIEKIKNLLGGRP
ncbi:MAG: DHH family phosphoesterase [bacterium]